MHTYCVVLRPQRSLNSLYPRTKPSISEPSQLLRQCLSRRRILNGLVFGVEPAHMSALPPQSECSVSTKNSIIA